jgi:hypothetical protein
VRELLVKGKRVSIFMINRNNYKTTDDSKKK